jgi:very-short-patch-repair endonuclease
LESNGYSKRFIHDENISWQVKYRPDFWFVKEGLIVEYDEKAHQFQIEEDRRREKIIQKYIPNINFIRVREGFEVEGLKEINEYLIRFESKYEL